MAAAQAARRIRVSISVIIRFLSDMPDLKVGPTAARREGRGHLDRRDDRVYRAELY
jgi:hypothetical protein